MIRHRRRVNTYVPQAPTHYQILWGSAVKNIVSALYCPLACVYECVYEFYTCEPIRLFTITSYDTPQKACKDILQAPTNYQILWGSTVKKKILYPHCTVHRPDLQRLRASVTASARRRVGGSARPALRRLMRPPYTAAGRLGTAEYRRQASSGRPSRCRDAAGGDNTGGHGRECYLIVTTKH